jgi:hypothetical protein
MDKWLKDILPDKDPYHNRGRDQMREKGGSGIRVPVVVTSSLCGVTKIDQFNRAAHLSLNSYIRSNKILNIVILLVYVNTNRMYKYFGKCILFLIKPLSLTIILPNFASNHRTVFTACGLWPLLGLDTPPKFFWHIKMAVHI